MIGGGTEHMRITLVEWERRSIDGVILTAADRRLAHSLANGGEGRLVIDELRNGVRATACSWVGVVRFSSFELQVVPKLLDGNLDLVRLLDYAAGLDCLARHPNMRTFQGGGAGLLDLLALLLAEASERLVRGGLLADYREVEEDLPLVRGRLRVREQVLRHFGRIDRLACRYDEHDTDTPENQLVLAALAACAPRVRHPEVGLRVRRMQGLFAEVCALDAVDLRSLRAAMSYNRLNEHYREAHGLAGLILDGLGIADLLGGGDHRCFAFLLDMNRLFEDFVTRWVTELLAPAAFHVRPQRRDRSIVWDAEIGRPYASVVPDLLIEHRKTPGLFLPLDAKYKLYDQRSIASGDLYQAFLYAYAYGQQHRLLPTSLIVHPASSSSVARTRLHIRRNGGAPGAEIRGLGINLPAALTEATSGKPAQMGNEIHEQIMGCFVAPALGVTGGLPARA